jgi:hypothetical protein
MVTIEKKNEISKEKEDILRSMHELSESKDED